MVLRYASSVRNLPLVRGPERATDPVCGMAVDPATAPASRTHAGRSFHFCHPACAAKFDRDPEGWLSGRAREEAAARDRAAPAGTVWICPMCPEVREPAPVPCPTCGMALEPLLPVGGAPAESPELASMRRRFLVGAAFSAPLLVVSMGPMAGLPVHDVVPAAAAGWVEAALAAPVVAWAGAPFLARGWTGARTGRPNMFTLIALGVAAAFLFSLAALVAPGALAGPAGHRGGPPLHFESAAVIVTLTALGQVLELRARARTGEALRALLDLAPRVARRVRPGGEDEEVPLDSVRVGDLLRARPGDRVPVDGVVVEGTASVDESPVTGEPIPADRGPGSRVTGGTLVADGAVVLRAERVGADTVLARIVAMVADAQRSRAPIQSLADRAASWFVPAVVAVAALAFAGWAAFGPEPRLAHALVAAVSVLVIACPCALGLATPMAVTAGMGRGAREGILFRDAAALEGLSRVDTLVVDKTGTLTRGRPEVAAVAAADGDGESSRRAVLAIAASVERWSGHPLAEAVVRAAAAAGIRPAASGAFRNAPGRGTTASVDGGAVSVGNAALLEDLGVRPGRDLLDRAAAEEAGGRTVAFVVSAGRAVGLLAFADTLDPTAAEAVRLLRADGVDLVLCTGDSAGAAAAAARALGIERVEARRSPAEKAEVVRRLQADGRRVGMAGDGVNDAPALAAATVGIAMGSGTDLARETAGVTLIRRDLRGLARARALSRATLRNVRQNLLLATGYNALCIPLAAGALYPLTGHLLPPMAAAAAMSLSSLSVVGNALRLRRARL
jgi:Cu+-exporting ATPase